MRILRFEHLYKLDGKWDGPYSRTAMDRYREYAGRDGGRDSNCPGPDYDHGLGDHVRSFPPTDQWFFGFDSPEQALRWFDCKKGRIAMAETCPPWAFECPEEFVFRTPYQLAFMREKAERLYQLNPVTLEPLK